MVDRRQKLLKWRVFWQRNKRERHKKNELQNRCSTAELTRLTRGRKTAIGERLR